MLSSPHNSPVSKGRKGMKAIWGWSLAVIGATAVCHAADSDPVAGIVSKASGGWRDTNHSRVLERGSDVLLNARIVRMDPPSPDAEIEIYLLSGEVIKQSCAKGACANPIEIKASQQDRLDLLKIIKDLLFSPDEQPVPAATMAATSGVDAPRSAAVSDDRILLGFATGVVAQPGTITNLVLSREPPRGIGGLLGGITSSAVGTKRPVSPVQEMFRVPSPDDTPSAPAHATVCDREEDTLALCEGQSAAPGTYAGRDWRIYLFESEAQVDCLSDALRVGKLLARWQAQTGDSRASNGLADKAMDYVDSQAVTCRR
jgi:hypothetical protein